MLRHAGGLLARLQALGVHHQGVLTCAAEALQASTGAGSAAFSSNTDG